MARTLKETTECFEMGIQWINSVFGTSLLLKYNRRKRAWRVYEENYVIRHHHLYFRDIPTDELAIILDTTIEIAKHFRFDREHISKLPFFNPSV